MRILFVGNSIEPLKIKMDINIIKQKAQTNASEINEKSFTHLHPDKKKYTIDTTITIRNQINIATESASPSTS